MDMDNDCVYFLDMNGIFIIFIIYFKIQGIGVMSMDINDKLWIVNVDRLMCLSIFSKYLFFNDYK